MTPEDEPFDEIGRLLRGGKPDPQPSPGLEARILRALRQQAGQRARPPRRLAWLFLPPALAMVAALALVAGLLPRPETTALAPTAATAERPDPERQPMTVPTPADPSATDEPADHPFGLLAWAAVVEDSPLDLEVRALRRDAERTRRFLIDCLPSFGTAGD
jgi:hypothetical protein